MASLLTSMAMGQGIDMNSHSSDTYPLEAYQPSYPPSSPTGTAGTQDDPYLFEPSSSSSSGSYQKNYSILFYDNTSFSPTQNNTSTLNFYLKGDYYFAQKMNKNDASLGNPPIIYNEIYGVFVGAYPNYNSPTKQGEQIVNINRSTYSPDPSTTDPNLKAVFHFGDLSATNTAFGFSINGGNYESDIRTTLNISEVNFEFGSIHATQNYAFGINLGNSTLTLSQSQISFGDINGGNSSSGISSYPSASSHYGTSSIILNNNSVITFKSITGTDPSGILRRFSGDPNIGLNINLQNNSSIVFESIKDSKATGICESISQTKSSLYQIDETSQILFSNIEATKQDAIGISTYMPSFNLSGGGNITFSNITSPQTASGIYLNGYYNTTFSFDKDTRKSKMIFTKISGGLAEGIYVGNGSTIGFEGSGEIEFTSIAGDKIAYGLHSESTNKINFYSFDDKAKILFKSIEGDIASYGIFNNGNAIYDFNTNGITFESIVGGKLRGVGIYNHQGFMEISGSITFESITNSFGGVYGIQNNGDILFTDGSSLTFGSPSAGVSDYKIFEGLGSTLELGNMVLSSSKDTTIGIKATDTTTMLLQANKTLNFDLKSTAKEGRAFDGGNLILSSQSQVIFNSNGGNLTSLSGNDGKILLSGTSTTNRLQPNSRLLLRSLEIANMDINNSTFVLYADKSANIDTTNGFDGRAYDATKTHTSRGGSDRLIINGSTLYTPTYNTLKIALSNFNETKTYVVLAEVDKSVKDTVIFNGLTQSGDRAKITSYAGFETQTLEIERYDGVDKTYYFSSLSTPDNSSNSGDGEQGGDGGGNSGGGGTSGGGSQGGGSSSGGGSGGGGGGSDGGGSGSGTGGGGTGGDQGGSGSSGSTGGGSGSAGGSGTGGGSSGNQGSGISINTDYSSSTIASIHSNFSLLSSNLNSLNKRMGDLRNNFYNQGVWARTFFGSLNLDFDTATTEKNTYWTIQAGYDYAFALENANNYLGFALSYINSQTTQDLYSLQFAENVSNSVSSQGVEFALYNAYIADNGLYTDSILKVSYLSSELELFNQNNSYKLDNYAFTLSQEIGYAIKLGDSNEWIITPQFEIAYSYLTATDFTQTLQSGHTMKVHQDSISLLRNRVGFDWRYDFSHLSKDILASLYLGTYYMYDVISGGDINLQTLNDSQNFKTLKSDGRMVLNVGTNINLYEHTSLYFDFEKSFFGKQIQTDYQVNLGVRYSFGEKIKNSIVIEEAENKDVTKTPLKIEEKTQEVSPQEESKAQEEKQQ